MKKNILYILGAILLVALLLNPTSASAQAGHRSLKFLTVPAVYVTNLFSITNLSTAGSSGTNVAGTVYTNGTTRVTASTGTSTTRPLLQDVPLWSLRTGEPAYNPSTNGVNFIQSYGTVSVTLTAGSGADSAITFVATPVYNGVNEATATGEEWTFAFTPTVSTTHTFVTNAPLHRWPGAESLRIRRIVNADTTAGGNVIITDLSLNGYVP